MNTLQATFQDFLATQSAQVPILGFVVNLLVCIALAFILSLVYVRFSNVLSNRRAFARNFVLITVTTMLVITVVKSSLALSLGLVGALSIVRFRAAIKEPEELAYLFLAVAIGLGLGANQRIITLVGFMVICGIIWLNNRSHRAEENQNLHLTISTHNPGKAELSSIVEVLKVFCREVELKRLDETEQVLEASFLVEFDDFQQLEASMAELKKLSDTVKITYLANRGIASIG